jgi:AcrR family transcriptional regulator
MGLRETKKLATRQQIADVAMRLFVQRGFDRVTVAEVAAEAGVSEKTVFNYFPTKEDLFFDEIPERSRKLAEAIGSRAEGETILDTLRRLQVGECARLSSPGFAAFARTLEDSQALRAKELEVMATFAQALTGTLEAEGIDPRDARIAASLRSPCIASSSAPRACRRWTASTVRRLRGGCATISSVRTRCSKVGSAGSAVMSLRPRRPPELIGRESVRSGSYARSRWRR